MTRLHEDRESRRNIEPVICYPVQSQPKADLDLYKKIRGANISKVQELRVPPRDARCFYVPKGGFFRIISVEGPQVGDLNLWSAHNLSERFYSGKTRALHGSHITSGHRMWSSFPYLRPMATIIEDTLGWYGIDPFGGSVHDVIGTRCDPYTKKLLSGEQYHYCCHSNLTRALAQFCEIRLEEAERHVHDVLNVFMCTGFTRDTGQYFMKASPVRPGDYLEFFSEIDLIVGLSACPGGDCSTEHSSDAAACFPLQVQVFESSQDLVEMGWHEPIPNAYDQSHGGLC
ncbi:MAG: hypothetical protein CL532_07280 [Aestuariivita sp.]|nr:hypothetical protein [Aestuariivita sp.]